MFLCILNSACRLYFWTDRSRIRSRTLSGIELEDCNFSADGASSLAVDAARRKLYWLSSSATGQKLKMNQLDYFGIHCYSNRYLISHTLTGFTVSTKNKKIKIDEPQYYLINTSLSLACP